MELLILCAGSADKSWPGEKSRQPLRTKGKRQAQKIGAWLGLEGLCPDAVLVDPTTRSRVTAEKALKAGGWTAHGIHVSPQLAEGRLPDPEIKAVPVNGRMLLVACPGTVRTLTAHLGLDPAPDLAPGVLLRLDHGADRTRMMARVEPGDLPDLFPYPAPNGPERRERPAYYYTQSAAIPFRRTPGGTEILIVGSSSGRHWVVPKGIVDPGRTPAASALNEAFEEAGVEGLIGESPLGSYTYEKWGATCHVEVFTLDVTRELPGNEWEENHRQRRWVSAEEAANLLEQDAMRQMVTGI